MWGRIKILKKEKALMVLIILKLDKEKSFRWKEKNMIPKNKNHSSLLMLRIPVTLSIIRTTKCEYEYMKSEWCRGWNVEKVFDSKNDY